MVKFNKLKIVLIVLCLLFLTSCEFRGQESTETSYQNSTNELTDKQKDALNNGYMVGKYKLLSSENAKNSEQYITTFINDNFFEDSILNVQSRIDYSKKINILTYAMHYTPEKERYTLGIFVINTSNENINSVKMSIRPIFKNISEGEFIEADLKGNDFPNLPTNGITIKSFSANAPIEDLDTLKENTAADITFEIKDLELNGEKVSNEN